MTLTQRKKIARDLLDKLGVDYPKSGRGSGAKALEALVRKKGIELAVAAGVEAVEESWKHNWYVADHAEETPGRAGAKRVVHYGKHPPKHPPEGGGRWKKRKKPPKWMGDAAKFAASIIAKIIL